MNITKKNKIFYSAYTCKGNTGDLIITKCQIEQYAKYGEVYVDSTGMPNEFKKVVLESGNRNVKDYVATYGIPYRGVKMFNVIRLLKKNGFTHFTKSPGPYAVIDFPIKKFLIRIIGSIGYWYAKRSGMKVIALGIDLNIPNNRLLRLLNLKYFSLYDILGIRSKKNFNILSGALSNIIYCPDMALLWEHTKKKDEHNGRVAFSFRRVSDISLFEKVLDTICDYLVINNYKIEFVYQVQEDFEFQKRIVERYNNMGVFFHEKLIGYDDLDVYSSYDYVISNRLHVLLMGAVYGSIPIGFISRSHNENKIADVFNSLFSRKLWFYFDENWNDQFSLLMSDKALFELIKSDIQRQKKLLKEIIEKVF